jgi:hypothetical protein
MPGLVFGGSEGVRSRFNVLRARTHFGGTEVVRNRFHVLRARARFRRFRGRRVPFSCFALPDTFSTVLRVSGPVLMFCAPGLVFDGSEGFGSRFHVLRARTYFGGKEGFGSRFHVLRSRTSFRRSPVCRVLFSCFALSDSFSAVPLVSGLDFVFCAPGFIFGGSEGVGSRFHVLLSRTRFRRFRGRRAPFSCFALPK